MPNREIQNIISIVPQLLSNFEGFFNQFFFYDDNITVFMEARSGLSDSSYDDTAKQITLLGISGFISRKMSYLSRKRLKSYIVLG